MAAGVLEIQMEFPEEQLIHRIAKFAATDGEIHVVMNDLIERLKAHGLGIMQQTMDEAIYSQPPPANTNRSGAMRAALRADDLQGGGDVGGQVHIPMGSVQGSNGFYYPWSAEKGIPGTAYYGRRFWQTGSQMIKAQFNGIAGPEVRTLAQFMMR
jgi:hypothetical protein